MKKDLTKLRFGNLVVIKKIGVKNKRTIWECLCDCGKTSTKITSNLIRGNSTRCSYACPLIKRYNFIDLTDMIFGDLKVIKKSNKKTKTRGCLWICECKCSKIVEVCSNGLTSGNNKSCGCIKYKISKFNNLIPNSFINTIKQNAIKRNLEFSVTEKYLCEIFNGRCALSGDPIYFHQAGYQANKNNKGNASLDRIDNNKGYIVDNVRWVHKIVNIMRGTLTDQEMINWCEKIYNNKCLKRPV